MIVVSDTSPINYLVLIEFHDLLPKLFEQVLIPEAVQRELQDRGTPEPVRLFAASVPGWLEIRSAPEVPVVLKHLDAGEREAIWLWLPEPISSFSTNEGGARLPESRAFRCPEPTASLGSRRSGSW